MEDLYEQMDAVANYYDALKEIRAMDKSQEYAEMNAPLLALSVMSFLVTKAKHPQEEAMDMERLDEMLYKELARAYQSGAADESRKESRE